MDKSDIPDLAKVILIKWTHLISLMNFYLLKKAPSSLLEALESHVNGIDNKKSTSSVTAAANPAKYLSLKTI